MTFWSLLSVAVLLNLSHCSRNLVISTLNPCARMTVNTPKRHGHPISLHINTTDKTKPRGFVMRDENSQNLDKCVYQLDEEPGTESRAIPLSYLVDVITGRSVSRNMKKRTSRKPCRIRFRIFPIFESLGRLSSVLNRLSLVR